MTELEDMDELQEINHDDEALQPQNEETDAIMTEETSEKEKHSPTIVDKFFTMEVRSCFTCDSCSYTRSHMETYRHLSIDIGDDNDTNGLSIQSSISSISQSQYERTVQEGLRKCFKNEKLECKCENCFGESVTLAKKIVCLPKVLLCISNDLLLTQVQITQVSAIGKIDLLLSSVKLWIWMRKMKVELWVSF